jgi:hypothetical protein
MHTSGKTSTTSSGKHYLMTTNVSETGSWTMGVDSGVFQSENLSQSVVGTGTVADGTGTHAITQKQAIVTTMQLSSTRSGPVQALGKSYATKTASPVSAGYSIAYPSSWTETDNASGNYEIASPDKTAIILGSQSSTAGDVSSPRYVSQFLRTMGTPIGTITNAVRTIDGQQYGIADAVLRLSGQPLEAQCEVRVRAMGSGVSIVVGIVSLGESSVDARTPDLAHEYEQVQRSLDSIHVTHVVGSAV